MEKRHLGRSKIEVSAMGMGCWAIGGPWTMYEGSPQQIEIQAGWGDVDDTESIKAIHNALDMGINFFDTAANYGAGHSERILGRAIADRRDDVVIATKFGYFIDEEKRRIVKDDDAVVGNVRQHCEDSLRRLDTDYIDLYQLHVGGYPAEQAGEVRDALEDLVAEGKIRAYGWSTDHPERARVFAEGEHCATTQHRLNVLMDATEMLALCDEYDMGSINKSPLMMGILTGKFTTDSTFPANDVRHDWSFREGWQADSLNSLDSLRQVLSSDGRSLAQGALGWVWARSERTIPIPGFKNRKQMEENAEAMEFGPLSDEQMRQIDEVLERKPAGAA
jgi:aryl-alcohol dehydrogenase-like predicted oxidoreductase